MVPQQTTGDRLAEASLADIGGKGTFVHSLQSAVLQGRADFAVHSAKDLPSLTHEALCLAAVPPRGEVRDALVGARLVDLPPGATVATGSARRRVQLAEQRPDLRFADLRGNIDTRLAKAEGFDAIVVALVALERLGRTPAVVDVLDVDLMVPQVGQGALAVECRADDAELRGLLSAIDDPVSRRCVAAERAFLAALGGDCTIPAGAHAQLLGDAVQLRGVLATAEGEPLRRATVRGDDGAQAGRELAEILLAGAPASPRGVGQRRGAAAMREQRALTGRRILVARPAAQGLDSAEILRATGAEPVLVPLIELSPPGDDGVALAEAVRRLAGYDWLVVTSANGAKRFAAALGDRELPPTLRVAAIGPATAAALAEAGAVVSLLPERFVAESLVDAFPSPGGRHGAGRVLVVRAEVARDVVPVGLRAKGWSVDVVAAYRAHPRVLTETERAAAATCDTVIFTSPSVVEAFCDQPTPLPVPETVAVIGPVTASAARRRNLTVHIEATEYTIEGLVSALAAYAG